MRFSYVPIVVVACLAIMSAPLAARKEGSGTDLFHKVSGVEKLHLVVGEPFLHARSRVIRLGWKPTPMHRDDNHEYDGPERRLAERSILEVDSCSIDAGANCILYYQKNTECLRLDTVGEQVDKMKITRWASECPGASS
jgi:hypothetical protein